MVPNKTDNYYREGEKRKKKKSKRILQSSGNIRIISVFLESLLSESFPSLGVTVHLTSLGCPPTLLISEPAVGAAQILIWSYSYVFLPPMSTAIRTSVFFGGWELSMTFYIFHRHRVCLVKSCGFNLKLVQLVGKFGSSSLATLPLGFSCGFIATSACGSYTGVCPWCCPGGLGFAPVRARCGGDTAACVTGVLAAPGTQGVGS